MTVAAEGGLRTAGVSVAVDAVDVSAYTVPTDEPESDGTAEWDSTTIVVVAGARRRRDGARLHLRRRRQRHGGLVGTRETSLSAATRCRSRACWEAMGRACRNLGRPGVASMAIAAVDTALWDLKARTARTAAGDAARRGARRGAGLRQRRLHLLHRRAARRAARRLGCAGHPAGEDEGRPRPRSRPRRASGVAREAIGPDTELFVDANGALARKQALRFAERFAEHGVTLVRGARLLGRPRRAAPAARPRAGRDGRSPPASTATRSRTSRRCSRPARSTACRPTSPAARASPGSCAWRRSARRDRSSSRRTAGRRSMLHPCCAAPALRHLEYFHDHVRIEQLLFDGVARAGRRCAAARPVAAPATGSSSSAPTPSAYAD